MSTSDGGHDRSQLGAYALGALESDEAREVEQHVAGCAECSAELAEFEEMKAFLGEVPPEAFLDGPPADGDLLLQRTLRAARVESTPASTSVENAPAGVGGLAGTWMRSPRSYAYA